MDFIFKLEKVQEEKNSLLCVGLDPDLSISKKYRSLYEFNKYIIDLTSPFTSCYKVQIAYYEAEGSSGHTSLAKTVDYIKKTHPQIPVICDAKRADISPTSEKYAQSILDRLQFDAITVNPYLGLDSIEPFLKRKEKGVFVLCRTSNKSATDFQDLMVSSKKLFIVIAEKIREWNKQYANLLLVAGSTWPEEIKTIRTINPNMIFLIPGIGAQGGDLQKTLRYGLRKDNKGLIISSSRGIIYDRDPKAAARKLRDEINKHRN